MTRAHLAALIAAIKKIREDASDETALAAAEIYPEWVPGKDYAAGERVRYGDHLYRVRQDHTSQETWTPTAAASLFEAVALPSEAGTIENPIGYSAGMELTEGMYYAEDGDLYVCFRNTGAPVYNPLAALVGIYVETV